MISYCSGRGLMGVVLLVLLLLGVGYLILGNDFVPWVRTVRDDARTRLEKLVDSHRLAIKQVEEAIGKVKETAGPLAEKVVRERVEIDRSLRDQERARQEILERKANLSAVRDKLEAHQPVRLVGGSELTQTELPIYLKHQERKMTLADEKLSFLSEMITKRQKDLDRLVKQRNQLPLTITELELSREYLIEKTAFYEQQLASAGSDESALASLENLVKEAQATLEKAHTEIDVRLATIQGVTALALDEPVEKGSVGTSTEEIVSEIQRIIGEARLAATN